ncbi:cytochrome P450 [Syncephalis plumigaleata]|nr:cytochrome P450 [Syncephalis plumigaleata]
MAAVFLELYWEIPLLLALVYIVQKFVEHELLSPLAKVPGPRPSIWTALSVNYKQFVVQNPQIILDLHRKYGPIVRTGPKTVWISDKDMIHKILGSHKYGKADSYHKFRLLGDNLFATQDIAYHRVQRRLMANAYTPSALRELEPMVYEVGVQQFVNKLYQYADAGDAVDLMLLSKHMTFDVIGKVAFGKLFNLLGAFGEKCIPVTEWIDACIMLIMKKLFLGPLFHSSMARHDIEETEKLVNFARITVEERRNASGTHYTDTLQKLIDAVDDETDATMSNDNIIAQTVLLMLAGTDTTAISLVWVFHFITEYPEYTRRLREEITAIYPDTSATVAYDKIKSLPYLEAFLQESMRMRGLVCNGYYRKIPKEGVVLGGYYLPEGTIVKLSPIVMNFDETVFPDANTFNPDRWFTTPEQLGLMKQYSIPFSTGVRVCIARNLAWMEIKLVIVDVLRRFNLTPLPGNDMTPIENFVLQPKGHKLMVQPHRI